jgi:hypothetical protein
MVVPENGLAALKRKSESADRAETARGAFMYATAIAASASASISALKRLGKREELDKDWLTCRVDQMSGKCSGHGRRYKSCSYPFLHGYLQNAFNCSIQSRFVSSKSRHFKPSFISIHKEKTLQQKS